MGRNCGEAEEQEADEQKDMGVGQAPFDRGAGRHRGDLRELHCGEAEAWLPARDSYHRVQLSHRHSRQVRGSKLRYRSGFPHNAGEEFDAPFARLDHIAELHSETRFDVMWHRHTGQRVLIHPAATLDEALELIETNPVLQPHT